MQRPLKSSVHSMDPLLYNFHPANIDSASDVGGSEVNDRPTLIFGSPDNYISYMVHFGALWKAASSESSGWKDWIG